MDYITITLQMAGGIIAGLMGALLGLGGGVFLIPFLILALHVPPHQAIATSAVAVIATSSAGAAVNLTRGIVHMRLAMTLEIATVIGAIAGGIIANILAGEVLTKIFSVMLVSMGIMMYVRTRIANSTPSDPDHGVLPISYHDAAEGKEVAYRVRRLPATLGVSLAAGSLAGLLGVGGGIFKVPAMHLLSGVPIKAAAATSNFMIGVTASASAFIYIANGHLNPVLTAAVVPGVLIGSMLGAEISKRIHAQTLTYIFIVILLAIAVRMFFK